MPTADELVTDYVKERCDGGVVTAVVLAVEYVDPLSGERHVYLAHDPDAPFWTRRGLIEALRDNNTEASRALWGELEQGGD